MNYILFDGPSRTNLLPFTYTRPVAEIRIGILTIREKWESYLESTTTTVTEDYLADKFPMVEMEHNVMINASFLPNQELVEIIKGLEENQAVFKGEDVIAFFSKETQEAIDFSQYEAIEYNEEVIKIEHTWDIFSKNGEALQDDFELLNRSYFLGINLKELNPTEKEAIIAEIEADFKEAFAGIKRLPLEAKFGVYTAYVYYKRLLKKLSKTPSKEILNTRIRVSNPVKISLLARSFVVYKLNLL